MEKELISNEIEFLHSGSDSGMTFSVKCPECKMKIRIAESQWWDTECECRLHWSLEIQGKGKK